MMKSVLVMLAQLFLVAQFKAVDLFQVYKFYFYKFTSGGQKRCHFEILPWLFFLSLLPLFICSPLLQLIFFRDMEEEEISELVDMRLPDKEGAVG